MPPNSGAPRMRLPRPARATVLIVTGAIAALSASPAYADVDGRGGHRCGLPPRWARRSTAVPHIKAANAHDLFFLQGWQHAGDRLFQMDVTRRRASGTLAELLGGSALPSDVQMRTLGLRRSAERTMSRAVARDPAMSCAPMPTA